jgi:hypothetical protein
MCVTSKLVTLCHYTVLTRTVYSDAQSVAISESMHQSKSIKSMWNTVLVNILYNTIIWQTLQYTAVNVRDMFL